MSIERFKIIKFCKIVKKKFFIVSGISFLDLFAVAFFPDAPCSIHHPESALSLLNKISHFFSQVVAVLRASYNRYIHRC